MINVEKVTKEYTTNEREEGLWNAIKSLFYRKKKTVLAVDSISFAIESGEMVGFLGPNGAGKSTTVKMLTGGIKPSSGSISVNGFHPWEDRKSYVGSIGVVFGQKTQLYKDLPALDAFELMREIYKLPQQEFEQNKDYLIELLGIEGIVKKPVRKLSLGQRMRCEFAVALLHQPDVLFLDEPTIGLDANAKIAVRNVLRTLNNETDVTMLLTTHDMDEVEALCERVIVLDEGKIIFDGSIQALRAEFIVEKEVTIDFSGSVPQALKAYDLTIRGSRIQGKIPASTNMEAFFQTVFEGDVVDITFSDEPLEGIIQRIYNAESGVSND